MGQNARMGHRAPCDALRILPLLILFLAAVRKYLFKHYNINALALFPLSFEDLFP
jgi:hypothetical protein